MPNPRKDLRVLLLANNGSLLRSAGRHDEALAAFTRGLDLIREGEITGRLEEMELLFALHLGALHSELGETGRAAAWLEEALALARRYDLGRSQAAALLQLGWVELLEARPEEAAEHFRAGLGVAGLGAETRSYLLQGLGTAYVEAGRPEAAVDVLTEAVAVAREAGATAAESEAVRRLAAAYLAGGRLEEAGAALEGALGRREEIAMPLVRGAVHSLYAQLERRRGNRRPALHHVLQALEMRESVRSSIASPALRASFLARWRDDYDLAVDLLMGLDAEEPGRGYAERAFEISEASHARTLTELLTEARIEVRRGIAPDLLARERRVAARLSLVQQELTARLSGDSPGAEEIARVRRAWEDLKREREAIEVEIRRQHPRYAAIRYPRPPAARDVRAALPPRTALVEFSLGAERSYLFVLTREGLSTFPLPPATNLAESVRAIRWTVGQQSPLTAPRLVAEGRRLYGQLLAPAEEVLRGVDHIDVVPDRDLFYLPFELLVTGGDGEGPPAWLVRRWSVAYAPSAAVFLSLGRPPAGDGWQGDLVGFADPATAVVDPPPEVARGLPTELAPGPALGPLPGARSELEGLAALFPADRTRVYLGGEALESALKQPGATSGMRRLHIASHGVIADENPADSFLLFTADPAAGDDGRLRVHEVFDLELGSETVVLSGCETGLGERVLGEGLVGMTRAFLYAGARQVVVSLWPVGDDSARDLMLDLYRGLRAGMGTADALRAAKLRRLGEDPAAKPFAWAPFILVGAADSM
jgi:CHAT domain-containing protein